MWFPFEGSFRISDNEVLHFPSREDLGELPKWHVYVLKKDGAIVVDVYGVGITEQGKLVRGSWHEIEQSVFISMANVKRWISTLPEWHAFYSTMTRAEHVTDETPMEEHGHRRPGW